jgi:hypothetical protein
VNQVYRRRGWTLNDQTCIGTRGSDARQMTQRSGEPTHRYSLDRHGVTADQLNAACARYTRFVDSNGIRMW